MPTRTELKDYADTHLNTNGVQGVTGAEINQWANDMADGAVMLVGDTMVGTLTIDFSDEAIGAPPALTGLHLKGVLDSSVRLVVDTMGNGIDDAPNIVYRWARNNAGSPSASLSGDILGLFSWFGYGATGYSAQARAQLRGVAAENWTNAAQGTRLVFFTSAIGAAAALERFGVEADGALSMAASANVIVTAARHFLPRSYTIATLPTPTVGEIIRCSDLGGGAGSLEADGSFWRRRTPGYQAKGNADVTLTVLTDAEHQNFNVTLTAQRTVTLSATRAYAGAHFMIKRSAAGAFNLVIVDGPSGGTLATFTAGAFAHLVFDGANWYLAD